MPIVTDRLMSCKYTFVCHSAIELVSKMSQVENFCPLLYNKSSEMYR